MHQQIQYDKSSNSIHTAHLESCITAIVSFLDHSEIVCERSPLFARSWIVPS